MYPRDVNEDSEVYYKGRYWNDLDCTNRMINRRISGDEAVNWWRHFAARAGKSFERALILNCGNGWVEREMYDGGLFKEAVGIDYSETLLDEAEAESEGRPLRYVRMNVNAEALPSGPFDLVVNHAAAHHVTRLDRLFRSICGLLPDDGWFISLDYVGPHRNQYAADAWNEAWNLNQILPEHLRQSMDYPLLPLYLEVDPTEAVHSELIVETLRRYFHVDEFVPLGGALAYPVLTHNKRLFSDAVGSDEQERWGQYVLGRDAQYLAENPESSLFAYLTGHPDKDVLSNREALAAWESAEDSREARAAENGGRYYETSMLNEVYWALAVREQAAGDLERELQTIRGSYLYSHLTRILEVPLVRRMLQSSLVRSLRRSPPSSG
jgi:SAM-dependent methyltransferase